MTQGPRKDRAAIRAALARRLMGLAPKAKLDALLNEADAKGMVRSIAAEDLYAAIADVGIEDAADIVQLASPMQFRTMVDLGVWKRDQLVPQDALHWLRAARGDESEDFFEKLHALDLEVLELVLREYVVLHDLEENPDVNPMGVTMETPDNKYLLEFKAEGADLAALRVLASDLIAANPFESSRLFEAVRWDLPSELQEAAYQFRSARLADLGFPTLYEALSIFTFIDPAKIHQPESSIERSALQTLTGHVDYVDAAFRGLSERERTELSQEVRYLVNAALVAEGAEPGDSAAIRRISEHARDYLCLGLEFLSDGDPERAADQVRRHHLRRVFQVGFSLTLRLKHRVDRLAKEPVARVGTVWMVLDEEAAALTALNRKRPLKALKVEGAEPVPFRSQREVAETNRLLDTAEGQRAVFARLLDGVDAAEALDAVGPAPTAERLFLATVLNAILDGSATPAPISEARVVEVCERLFEGSAHEPRLRTSAIERAKAALKARAGDVPVVDAMVDRTARRLLMEMGGPYLRDGQVAVEARELIPTA